MTSTLMRNNIVNYSIVLLCNFFCLLSYSLLSFPVLLRSVCFLPFPSVKLFRIFVIPLVYFVTYYIPSWGPLTFLTVFFFNLPIVMLTPYAVELCGFWQMYSVTYLLYSTIKMRFATLKISCVSCIQPLIVGLIATIFVFIFYYFYLFFLFPFLNYFLWFHFNFFLSVSIKFPWKHFKRLS